ncbi:MAG TPA: ergothioneine biosynthesis protein EgtB [Longimicrobiales bacterium]|nr:ergothioneine biosynthesis protein EgtB [Longimicrobiales bacterium]
MATVVRQDPAADNLTARYDRVRELSEQLCEPLATEDYVVQSMEDVSPTKWHLAHTSWFYETFILKPHLPGYRELNPAYAYLFNSYYMQAGERHCRAQRGYISRPTVAEVFQYRHHVDEAMRSLLGGAAVAGPGGNAAGEGVAADPAAVARLLEIGLNHEQQHQELMLTDIKHVFSVNPLRPAYRTATGSPEASPQTPALEWADFEGGLCEIGHDGAGFSYDNESPRHRVWLEPFQLANRLVTAGEYMEFMADGGYQRPELWLSMGWATLQEQDWSEPFYWEQRDGAWMHYTLAGMRPVDPAEPICHLSYFEADAFARWAGARLPTEPEWEVAAATVPVRGNFVEDGVLHPAPASSAGGLQQIFGDVWEWTSSQYTPYPGYTPPPGALGEYNGKFMCNQFVLRGGSCATSQTHIRATYRNFFPPDATWQFSGLRLARGA